MILNGGRDKLFVGPFIGEFGHELFSWQAYMREYAKSFERVVVSTRKEYRFLYEDFFDEFVGVDPKTFMSDTFDVLENIGEANRMCRELHSRYIDKGYTVASPNAEDHRVIMKKLKGMKPTYRMYGEKADGGEYDVIFHPRNFQQFTGRCSEIKKSRDWGLEKWNLLSRKIADKGYGIATIGLSCSAFEVEGTDDLRDIGLKQLADVLRNAKCIMGPSSGPLHFATLCGCGQIVWSHSRNRERYLKVWNPFNTKCRFYDDEDWNPSVSTVVGLLDRFMR